LCKRKVAVIGVGNLLMGDEGVGIAVVRRLEKVVISDELEIIDAGTSFFTMVSELRRFQKVIIVDAVHGREAPGSVYRFTMEDVEGKKDSVLSLHDFGVFESIRLERLIAPMPEEIIFYGVEPLSVRLTMQLSPTLQEKVGYVVQKIIEELKESGICIKEIHTE